MGATASIGGAALSAGSNVSSAYSQANALKMQGDYQKSQYEQNARIAEIQEKDAIARGDREALAVKKKVKGVIGAQRAAMAAQGIEINDDSALDIQADTAAAGAEDVLTVKNNAWREAWGYKVQASNYNAQGSFAQMASKNQAKNTLLTGGLQAVSSGLQGYKSYSRG